MATESGKADTLERRREEKRGEEVYGIDNGGGVGRGKQIYSFLRLQYGQRGEQTSYSPNYRYLRSG